jgi:predicted metal-dependent peptidase
MITKNDFQLCNRTAEDKLTRARIQIQYRNPFFARLSLYLKFVETNSKELDGNGAGVDADGNLYYDPKWIKELSDEQTIGLILHEIMHLSFLHLLRRGNRAPIKWNIACDIAVNKIIQDNNFELPEGGINPDGNQIKIFAQTIKDLDKKTVEIIYDELKIKEIHIKIGMKGNGKGAQGRGFDKHMEGSQTKEEKQKQENEWLNRVEEAYVGAKMRGELPAGIERLIGKLHESKVNWRSMLQRYLTSYIPYDYTYARPNKKSISAGYYMPDYIKEKIEVCVGIDTSGSIGEKELNDFISEIVGLARVYQNRVDMNIICHDVDVQNDLRVTNGSIYKIKDIKIKGGGGTSHKPIFEYINTKHKNCRVAVFLTDGYSDLNRVDFSPKFGKIFIISEGGDASQLKKKECKIIELKPNHNDADS